MAKDGVGLRPRSLSPQCGRVGALPRPPQRPWRAALKGRASCPCEARPQPRPPPAERGPQSIPSRRNEVKSPRTLSVRWRLEPLHAFASPTPDATPVWLVSPDNWEGVKTSIGVAATAFAERCGFKPKAGRIQFLPGEGGALAGALFGVDGESAPSRDPFAAGKLATSLPEGVYRFANPPH